MLATTLAVIPLPDAMSGRRGNCSTGSRPPGAHRLTQHDSRCINLPIDHERASDAAWIMDPDARVPGEMNPRARPLHALGGVAHRLARRGVGRALHPTAGDDDRRAKDSPAPTRRISVDTVCGLRSGPVSNTISWEAR